MLEDTYILYTSDHGEALGEHGLFYKQSPYEASVTVPLVVAGPGVPENKRVQQPVSLVDLYPTVMDMAGLKTEPDRPGQSLLSLAREEASPQEYVFAEYHGNFLPSAWYMLREGPLKYIFFSEGPPVLFDLEKDPQEQVNVADKELYQQAVQRLEKRLRSILDPETVSLRAKRELGLIGPDGEDYTQTLSVEQLRDAQQAGRMPLQPEFEKDYEGEML
jgi:choline-sulfatase